MNMKNEFILGYRIITETKERCVARIVEWIENGEECRFLACANPHSLQVARKDPFFEEALKSADILIPDGSGLLLGARILGVGIESRVTGSDIFLGLSRVLNGRTGYSQFFLGTTEENLNNLRQKAEREFPSILTAGTYSPPFRDDFSEAENREMLQAINNASPDILWVGMTAPKQEKWIYKNRNRLKVKFVAAVGAVFDFYTGRVKRSHPVFQNMGLEWLPRLVRQPRRMWKRNFVSNTSFVVRVVGEAVRRKRGV